MNVGKFEILKEVGRGGYGIVYKAHDQALNRTVALKILHPVLLIDDNFVSNFKTEAQIAAKLNHPNLVQIYEFGKEDGKIYFVMSYMAGGSLKYLLIKKGALPNEQAMKILGQIGAGLAYAHHQSIVHRDLKPANILFDDMGNVHISDMGLAKIIHKDGSISMSGSAGIGGTPSYMAPEIWQSKETTPATDIYGLACIFVEMISGKVLFSGESIPEIMLKHFEPLKLPTGVPTEWAAILKKALEKDPEDRYQNVEEFVSEMQNAQLNPAETAKPEPIKQSQRLVNSHSSEKHFVLKSNGQDQSQNFENLPDDLIHISTARKSFFYVIFILLMTAAMFGFYQLGRNAQMPIPVNPPPKFIEIVVTSTDLPTEPAEPTSTATPTPTETPTPTATAKPTLGASMLREKDGAEMIYIPEGSFEMGNNSGLDNERPLREVTLDGYWIDKFEVTNGLYQKCVAEGVCKEPSQFDSTSRASYYDNPAYNNYPVIFVDWNQAKTFCQWAGADLPSEAQWEKAARGTNGSEFPWGNARPNRPNGNFVDPNMRDTNEVGIYPDGASFYGVMDMAGNVWEWVDDWYNLYDPNETDNPQAPETGDYRIRRGGGWYSESSQLRLAYRSNYALPEAVDRGVGFRCAISDE